MKRKIGNDAFEYYVSLGASRSYAKVAERYGCGKRAVSKRAVKEDWSARLAQIESDARKDTDKKLTEGIEEMRERHLKTLRAMNARALSGLKSFPLTSGIEAIRAAELVIKLERLVAGEASERTAVCVEEVIKQEYDRWMVGEADGVREN